MKNCPQQPNAKACQGENRLRLKLFKILGGGGVEVGAMYITDLRDEDIELSVKVVIVGNGAVGKSSMIQVSLI